jgi:hypothetical protein
MGVPVATAALARRAGIPGTALLAIWQAVIPGRGAAAQAGWPGGAPVPGGLPAASATGAHPAGAATPSSSAAPAVAAVAAAFAAENTAFVLMPDPCLSPDFMHNGCRMAGPVADGQRRAGSRPCRGIALRFTGPRHRSQVNSPAASGVNALALAC